MCIILNSLLSTINLKSETGFQFESPAISGHAASFAAGQPSRPTLPQNMHIPMDYQKCLACCLRLGSYWID